MTRAPTGPEGERAGASRSWVLAGCCASTEKQSAKSIVLSEKAILFFVTEFSPVLVALCSLPIALCAIVT